MWRAQSSIAPPPGSDRQALQKIPLGTRAHYDYGGSHYSRASTHVGNSLIMYTKSGKTVAGSVEEIHIRESGPEFVVRRQAPLPAGTNDPFKAFPDIPATIYSSKMSDQVDTIHPKAIIGHYAASSSRTIKQWCYS
ncbi:hypothetical protein B0H12DRAFT_1077250 [Mycena haematopus]|nr:hypothetical protein B0H12DRAFT_1077250 [Mycena haematopus]